MADGNAVKGWVDQSGNNNNATHMTGGTLKLGSNGIGGKAALMFPSGNRLETTSFLTSAYDHAVTIYAVCSAPNSQPVETLLTFGSDLQNFFSATTNISPQAWGVVMPVGNSYFVAPPGTRNAHVLAIRLDGTFEAVFLDNRYYMQYDNSAAGLSGVLRIARPGSTDNYNWSALVGDILVYNSAHTQAQSRQVIDYLLKKYGENSLYNYPVVAVQGNSWVFGYGATPGKTDITTNVSVALGNSYNFYHCGVPGRTIDTCATQAPTEIDPGLNPSRTDNIFIGWEIVNQLGAGSTPAQVMAKLASWCNARRAAGWNKIILIDSLPNTAQEANREAVNSLLASDFSTSTPYSTSSYVYAATSGVTYADYLVKVSADPNMGGSGQNTNSTYYYSDHIHPNDNGYAILAPYLRDGIRAALGQ
jgi:hypothetical protein